LLLLKSGKHCDKVVKYCVGKLNDKLPVAKASIINILNEFHLKAHGTA